MIRDPDDKTKLTIDNKSIGIVQGDLTEMEADALVNAANNHLWMGGGVAGALKRKGGKIIETEALEKGPIPIGEAVLTTAGKLKAKYVIHAAGMGTDLRTDADKIKNATHNALKRAHEANLNSVAFPAIGTGVGGFTVEKAAEIMLGTAVNFLKTEHKTSIENIIFVLYTQSAYSTFKGELKKINDELN
jgi:O-acetyl-ADP-ribose deacetylase (regulator of RNase III)